MKQFSYTYRKGDITVSGKIKAVSWSYAAIMLGEHLKMDGLSEDHDCQLTEDGDCILLEREEKIRSIEQDLTEDDYRQISMVAYITSLVLLVLVAFVLAYFTYHDK